jgi:hypothetical protein
MRFDEVKKYAIAALFLVIASIIILIVDKYYANTPLGWAVMVVGSVGYLLIRLGSDLPRFPKRKPSVPKSLYTGPARSFIEPESERSFNLTDVVKIEIETTGDGPFDEDLYWIFHLQTEPPVRMAGPVALGSGIFDTLEGFTGADIENTIQAAATVEPAMFLIWKRDGNA